VRALLEFDRRNGQRRNAARKCSPKESSALREALSRRPWWVEYTAGFFPVISLVFVSVVPFEPFRIPHSGIDATYFAGRDCIWTSTHTEYGAGAESHALD